MKKISDGYDYYCGKCNCSFSIQSDKEIAVPVDVCCFCGSDDIY